MTLPVNQFLLPHGSQIASLFLGSLLLTLGVTNIILVLLQAFGEIQINKKFRAGISWRDILFIAVGLSSILITFLLKFP